MYEDLRAILEPAEPEEFDFSVAMPFEYGETAAAILNGVLFADRHSVVLPLDLIARARRVFAGADLKALEPSFQRLTLLAAAAS